MTAPDVRSLACYAEEAREYSAPGVAAQAADALAGMLAALPRGGILRPGMKRGKGSACGVLDRRYVEADDPDRLVTTAGLRPRAVRHGRSRGVDGHPAGPVLHLSEKPDA